VFAETYGGLGRDADGFGAAAAFFAGGGRTEAACARDLAMGCGRGAEEEEELLLSSESSSDPEESSEESSESEESSSGERREASCGAGSSSLLSSEELSSEEELAEELVDGKGGSVGFGAGLGIDFGGAGVVFAFLRGASSSALA
jgi:hypothetical protein